MKEIAKKIDILPGIKTYLMIFALWLSAVQDQIPALMEGVVTVETGVQTIIAALAAIARGLATARAQ